MNMKRLLIIIFSLTFIICHGQINVLTLKDSTNYNENNIILRDKKITKNKFTLSQEINYNEPGSVDEEFSYTLTLVFPEPEAANTKKTIDLSSDTTLVQSSYGVFSVWRWNNEKCKISGQIEIVDWNKNSITIKENISIYVAYRNETITFIGTRTFKKKKGW